MNSMRCLKFIKILLLSVCFKMQNAGAEDVKYNGFRCIPSIRQTRIQVLERDTKIELRITNPQGYEFMPQFDGSGTAFGLAFNRMQAEDLKDLADVFTLTWSKEKCKLNAKEFLVSCQGAADEKIGSVSAWGITTTKINEEIDNERYIKRRYRLAAENVNTYFVNLEFYLQNCETFN